MVFSSSSISSLYIITYILLVVTTAAHTTGAVGGPFAIASLNQPPAKDQRPPKFFMTPPPPHSKTTLLEAFAKCTHHEWCETFKYCCLKTMIFEDSLWNSCETVLHFWQYTMCGVKIKILELNNLVVYYYAGLQGRDGKLVPGAVVVC